jgi:hypothetical protein
MVIVLAAVELLSVKVPRLADKMSSDLVNSKDAANAFKDTVVELMTGLQPIIRRYDPNGWSMPDVKTLLNSAGSGGGLSKIFDEGLTPTVKFIFCQAWAKGMNAPTVMEQFIASTKQHWKRIETGTEKQQEQALLSIIDGLNIPGSASSFLRSLYEKKDLLSPKERAAIVEYFKTCCYYGEVYEEFKADEKKAGRK